MKPEFNLSTPVQFLKSVGPARTRALTRLGIETVGHLLEHFPHRYHDRSQVVPLGKLKADREMTVAGEVLTASERRLRRGGSLQTVTVGDNTGIVFCVWFNQRYVLKQFRPGLKVMLSGRPSRRAGRWQLAHPDFELLSGPDAEGAKGDSSLNLNTGRLVPVYGLTSGVGQHWLRSLVWQALEKLEDAGDRAIPDPLPRNLRRERGLKPLGQALRDIHFPATEQDRVAARKSLVYRELFAIQLLMAMRRAHRLGQPGLSLAKPGDLTRRLVETLPFALTGAQRRVLKEILADLRSGVTMNRLLQGDVGSGKTLVAFLAALFVIEQGYQAVLLAPTEVLARQHGQTLQKLAAPLDVTCEVLTGSTVSAERRAILNGVMAGEVDLLVGTHAVIQEDVRIPRLALAVVDEQHRFGVRQRWRSARSGEDVGQSHVLVMSATPIPRSLSLTLYGDLDLSLIDELPPGRQPIVTRVTEESAEERVWKHCRAQMAAGRQVYVIHPVIEETEGQDLKAAVTEFERLSAAVFPEHRIGLLHGKLHSKEKQAAMEAFARGELDLLVATTVVEVGLDVPNATEMVIHNPERFGLAQLHQLRGRVGRGRHASTCWLICPSDLPPETRERIQFFADHLDGFDLAEEDLRRRGPGDAWGVRQHGVPGFHLANPLTDTQVLRLCQADARAFLARDPELVTAEGKALAEGLSAAFARALPGEGGSG
jgi:ATP-dependent DNA helicase RecG